MKIRWRCGLISGLLILFMIAPLKAQTNWSSYPGNPLISGGALDPSVVFDSTSGVYSIWYVTPDGLVRQGKSSDGLVWTISDSVALSPGPAGSYDQLIASVSVVKSSGGYFMYYTALGPANYATIGLAVSTDGLHWQKHESSPILGPGVTGTWEYISVTGARVILVNGTYFMMYSGYDGVYQGVGLATSTDGIAWTKSLMNPLVVHGSPGSVDAQYVAAAGIAYKAGLFYLIYRATNSAGVASYCLATSPNGTQWQKYAGNPLYIPSGYGWDAYQIGGGSLLWTPAAFKFWYCAYGGSSWAIGLSYLSSGISVSPAQLDFGFVRVGSTDSLAVVASNLGGIDTLRVSSISSNNPVFSSSTTSLTVPPGTSRSLFVKYTPAEAGRDSGLLAISSNAPESPLLHIKLAGTAYALKEKPTIAKLLSVPNTYYQIRVNWIRSLLDTAGAADQVVQYSIWRMVPGVSSQAPASRPAGILPSSTLIDPAWDFMETVPSAGFDQYGAVIPAFVDYTAGSTANVIIVAAHTKNLNVYISDPDTIIVDPGPVTGVSGNTQEAISYSLAQNFPNPFNPSTIIRYGLPRASAVTLTVFNTLGQQVALLVDAFQGPGYHDFRFDASSLASGVYLYRLKAEGFVQTRKLILLK